VNNVKSYSESQGKLNNLIFSKDRKVSNNIIEHLFQKARSYVEQGYQQGFNNEELKLVRQKRQKLRTSNESLGVK
jgi:hypothetical protein